MAKRYKDEMMRLYYKANSGAGSSRTEEKNQPPSPQSPAMPSRNMQNDNVTGDRETGNMAGNARVAPNNMTENQRDIFGTPVPNVPGASFYGMNTGEQPVMPVKPVQPVPSVPSEPLTAQCECRFPSAESIINSIANTPMTLPATEQHMPQPQPYGGNTGGSTGNMTGMMPQNTMGNMSGSMPKSSAESGQTGSVSGETRTNGVFIGTAPSGVSFSVPSEAERETEEILPDFTLPPDVAAEESALPSVAAAYRPSMKWTSLTGDTNWGFLQVEVFTANGGYPVPGAVVIIKRDIQGGAALVRVLTTNRSGKTPTIALPAPSERYSQYPQEGVRPFAEYDITVSKRGYFTISDINMPIFAGIKTVQPIEMIPLPQFSNPPSQIQPRTEEQNGIYNSPSVG
ncbi:MAG: hypothetical protein ACI4JJ_02025 [Huintestinicola sp.]